MNILCNEHKVGACMIAAFACNAASASSVLRGTSTLKGLPRSPAAVSHQSSPAKTLPHLRQKYYY